MRFDAVVSIHFVAFLLPTVTAQATDAHKMTLKPIEKGENVCALDNKELIVPAQNVQLSFCKEHEGRSCCTEAMAQKIRKTVRDTVSPRCETCYGMFKDIKCSECSSNSSMFYHGDKISGEIKLCEDYCHTFFEACKHVPFGRKSATGEFFLGDLAGSADEFCRGRVEGEPFCYRGDMPASETYDTKCGCNRRKKCRLKNPKKGKNREGEKPAASKEVNVHPLRFVPSKATEL